MRLPFPSRIPLAYASTFAVLLAAVQIFEGTPAYFALLTVYFIFVATLAFNAAGGLSRPSGGYIFAYAVLAVLLGITYKAWLGEPATSNLANPRLTMLVYAGGITGLYGAALLVNLVLPRRALLENISRKLDMGAASLGCFAIGFAIDLVSFLPNRLSDAAAENGSLLGAVHQLDKFFPLGILLGVTHTIRQSNGRRFLSLPVLVVTIAYAGFFGVINFSKEGLFLPFLCILIAAAAARFRFTLVQCAVFLLGLVLTLQYLVPIIQFGKGVRQDTVPENAALALSLLLNPHWKQDATAVEFSYDDLDDFSIHYYDKPQGIFDRLQMISIDDALIDITAQGHVFGLTPVFFAFTNVIPHFLWKDKPTIPLGNMYSHEIGLSHYSAKGENDDTTGISFSPTADAFHEARWYGVLLVAPLLWFGCFFVLDWLCGDARRSPWGLLAIALSAHIAPEGMLAGPVYLMTMGALVILLMALLAAYVLPILALLVAGPARRLPALPPRIRSIPARPIPRP